MSDPYRVLGVARDADTGAIKRAYRRLAKELHPDFNPGNGEAERRFKEVTTAYELLSDEKKRARYDRGEIDAEGRERAPFGAGFGADWRGRAGGGFGFGRRDFKAEDLFSDLFASFGGAQRGGRRGEDVTLPLKISFVEAARGGSRRIRLPDGRNVEIRIPTGATDGTTLRLAGQGRHAPGSANGDILIELSIEPHRFFRREGTDIHIDLPVTLKEAVLGAKVEAPTIDGPVTLTIPKGSDSGRVLRLRGRGIGDGSDGPRGDQYVRLQIMLADPSDPELVRFAEGWDAGTEANPRERAGMTG